MFFETIILVTGIVQGVGFRPFCARLALDLGLSGSVRNTSDGVELTLQGKRASINSYIAKLQTENPDASAITSVVTVSDRTISKPDSEEFTIRKSVRMDRQRVLIPPDIATCSECLAEMNDPNNRRYRYPFINCTNCGPRYSIIKDLPYDRPKTTMGIFRMCEQCHNEYTAPENRRYHAQPNACFDCGPRLWLSSTRGDVLASDNNAIETCCKLIEEGNIAAIKGLGGFHLACNPQHDAPVKLLRERKGRNRKPFALMVRDMEIARTLVDISANAQRILTSSKRPIVLCKKNSNTCSISGEVAPGQDTLGIMLPYTPLHHLIMQHFPFLIMTSANLSDSPIVADNTEALEKLKDLADIFLMHNRDIHMPIDDSVVSVLEDKHIIIRRSRGFVPAPLGLPQNSPVILAAGAEMKSTFSLTQEKMLFPGQYLGDLKELPTIEYYRKALKHFLRLYNLNPRYLAHDLHPQYLSTGIAREMAPEIIDSIGVQHHHAHMAACLLENRHTDKAIGVIFDGTGYGTDGTIWGGEFLVGDTHSFERAGSLLPSTLPGGERSILEPWRYALSLLFHTWGKEKASDIATRLWPQFRKKIPMINRTIENSPVTTSAGRLFDGISAILGICNIASYDGQAASELESLHVLSGRKMPFDVAFKGGKYVLDWRPGLEWLISEIGNTSTAELSGAFHSGLAHSIGILCTRLSADTGIRTIALSGGVWQNRTLLALTCSVLEDLDFTVLTHKLVSPNDECVSVGQAAIAARHWS
jgi:hydrogenase maturation protein HypF